MSVDTNPFLKKSIAEAVSSTLTLYTNLIFLRHSLSDIFSIHYLYGVENNQSTLQYTHAPTERTLNLRDLDPENDPPFHYIYGMGKM